MRVRSFTIPLALVALVGAATVPTPTLAAPATSLDFVGNHDGLNAEWCEGVDSYIDCLSRHLDFMNHILTRGLNTDHSDLVRVARADAVEDPMLMQQLQAMDREQVLELPQWNNLVVLYQDFHRVNMMLKQTETATRRLQHILAFCGQGLDRHDICRDPLLANLDRLQVDAGLRQAHYLFYRAQQWYEEVFGEIASAAGIELSRLD